MEKQILITGSSGFLGSQICLDLEKQNYKVTAIDFKEPKERLKNVDYIVDDLNNYIDNIENFNKYDLIIHGASILPYKNNEKRIWNINYGLTKKIIDKLNISKNVFFVYISSSAVYGKPKRIPVNENVSLNPLDVYAKSKVETEKYIQANLNAINFSIIRPRTILGDKRSGIFDIFFNLIKYRIPLPIPNNGDQKIQFVEVRDLSKLTLHLGLKKISGIWPAAGPDPMSMRNLLNDLSKIIDRRIVILNINPIFFKFIGKILISLKMTNFTPWHFGAFPYDFYFDNKWIPKDFVYEYTSSDAFFNTSKKFFDIKK